MEMELELVNALNQHIELELASSYLFLRMASWLEKNGLAGFGEWIRGQAREETRRAMTLFNYLVERKATVSMGRVEVGTHVYISAHELLKQFQKHERMLADCLRELKTLALAARESRLWMLLNKFVDTRASEDGLVRVLKTLELSGARQAEVLERMDSRITCSAEEPEEAMREVG